MKKSITTIAILFLFSMQHFAFADKLNFQDKYWGGGLSFDDEVGFRFYVGGVLDSKFGKDAGLKSFGFEVGYYNFGDVDDTIVASYGGTTMTTNISTESSGFYLAAVGKVPVSDKVDFIGKLGIMRWSVEAESTIDFGGSVTRVTVEDDGFDPIFSIGAAYAYNKNTTIIADYTIVDTGDSDVDVFGLAVQFRFK